MQPPHAQLRQLPAVQGVLQALQSRNFPIGPDASKGLVRSVLDQARARILAGEPAPSLEHVVRQVETLGQRLLRGQLRRVINATGVVIHTNLGRAPLGARAVERLLEVAQGYSNLEYDLEEGTRGGRQEGVVSLLCGLTGAEDALVVNNNAAALVLALATLAAGREVIVSRGELVEIGGSFRVPEILETSGCRLREVGATNRTHLSDYAQAIGSDTAVLLKVHPSNFRMIGFTQSVDASALATLAHTHGKLALEDLGSGCLLDLSSAGLGEEPTARSRVESGLDLITMSGDKLLGGPQAGILLGRKELITRCRKHPLARAFRLDKLCLAALEGTLLSIHAQQVQEVPVLNMLTRPLEQLQQEAEALAQKLRGLPMLEVSLQASASRVGGGAYPEHPLPTCCVGLGHPMGSEKLAEQLRGAPMPIIVRQQEGRVLLDPRTLLPGDDGQILTTLESLLTGKGEVSSGGP